MFGVVVIAFLVVALVQNANRLRDVHLQLAPAWLLAAFPLTLLGGVLLPSAWREILVAYGFPLRRSSALRVWCVSQAARFVPGTVAFVASRIVLTVRQGATRSVAAASLVIEMGLLAGWCALYASWLPSRELAAGWRVLLFVGASAGLVLVPTALRLAGARVPRFPSLRADGSGRVAAYRAVALYGVNNLVRSVAFFFVTAALVPVHPGDVFLVVAATNLGALAGMVGITPAGIGVREGALVALLGHRFGIGNAAALAVTYRVWELAFELVWLAVAHVLDRRPASDVVEVTPAEVP